MDQLKKKNKHQKKTKERKESELNCSIDQLWIAFHFLIARTVCFLFNLDVIKELAHSGASAREAHQKDTMGKDF